MPSQASRSSRRGSFSTLLGTSKSIVARSPASYAGHSGRPSPLGLPLRANVVHALLMVSASSKRSGVSPVIGATSGLSKTKGISIACDDLKRFPSAWLSQVNRYIHTGAPPAAALRSASSLERRLVPSPWVPVSSSQGEAVGRVL